MRRIVDNIQSTFLTVLLLTCVASLSANAQEVPLEYVTNSVGAVLVMLDSEGDDNIETFIETAGDGRDSAVQAHVSALEGAAHRELDDIVAEFEARRFTESMLAETTKEKRRELLSAIKEAMAQAGAVLLDERNGDVLVRLEGRVSHEIVFRVEEGEPYAIDNLRISKVSGESEIVLTRENLADTFQKLEGEGFSGVVHVRIDGEVLLEEAYGNANPERDIKTSLDTIFGIGSMPIDFTIASIYLLEQEGRIDRGDTVGSYFNNVPADKREITIGHLMSGRSGLPDFHDTEEDWDPDLAWIDRETAEKRIFAMPLLFAPGTSRAHSHAAFVLLAALIERVSGQDYYSFIRSSFLDPAGMNRTGMYGEHKGLSVSDFAVGGGPGFVGVPNIPPNWGPTSWLVMGSGGMYSSLGDMLSFYSLVSSERVLAGEYARHYLQDGVGIGGSDRGFYIFHAYSGDKNVAMMIVNMDGRTEKLRLLSGALEQFIKEGMNGN